MSQATTTGRGELSGDLLRLSEWWRERADGKTRIVAEIALDSPASESVGFTEQVDRAIDAGASVVCIYGQPEDASMRAAIATQTGVNAALMVEQLPGMSDLEWMRAVAEVRDDRQRAMVDERIGELARALRRCSDRRSAVIFDGAFAHAAALHADRVTDRDADRDADQADIPASYWWLPASSSTSPAITQVQDELGLVPALDLRVNGMGDAGVRAVLAMLDAFEPSEED